MARFETDKNDVVVLAKLHASGFPAEGYVPGLCDV
jgi:hypothetical protein